MNNNLKWWISVIIGLVLMLGLVSAPIALAESGAVVINMETVSGGGTGYTYSGGIVTINQDGSYEIIGVTTTKRIRVEAGVEANITLNCVNINVTGIARTCAFDMSGATVNLTLIGENLLNSGSYSAGLQVQGGASLNITEDSTGILTSKGGQYGSGIGSGGEGTDGNISISGGEIIAAGGTDGAGIGSGGWGKGSINVSITGGKVTATGGECSAGIGNGDYAVGGRITIQGGIIKANGGNNGAGIGSGTNAEESNVSIIGGNVVANGGSYGAGIGGGLYGKVGDISITGGNVTIHGGFYAAGIGGGGYGSGGKVYISGESTVVDITGGERGAGIGGGRSKPGGTVSIAGGTVKVTGGYCGAGIGGGEAGLTGTVNITGGSVTANSGGYAAGIGGGADGGGGGYVNITGGIVNAKGGISAAGIGGGISGSGSTVYISGKDTVVNAASDKSGYGHDIGTGYLGYFYGSVGSVKVDGGATLNMNLLGTNSTINFITCTIGGAGAEGYAGIYFRGKKVKGIIDVFAPISGAGYTYSDNMVTINENGSYAIIGSTKINHIKVDMGVTADIMLSDVNIDLSEIEGACAFDMTGATVNLTLLDVNTLKSGSYKAGLQVPSGAALTIKEESTGSLNTTGGNYGAGIGGGEYAGGGTITISGGKVNAAGGYDDGAGIGGGLQGAGGTITISSGTVIATGGNGGADIGNGGEYSGTDGSTFITGGSVNAATGCILPNPINKVDASVYITKITIPNITNEILITGLEVSQGGLSYSYGKTNILTDFEGNLYLWLPANEGISITEISVNGVNKKVKILPTGNKDVITEIYGTPSLSVSSFIYNDIITLPNDTTITTMIPITEVLHAKWTATYKGKEAELNTTTATTGTSYIYKASFDIPDGYVFDPALQIGNWSISNFGTEMMYIFPEIIADKANPIYIIPTPGEITYDLGKTLADVTLPDGWTWNNPDAVPTVDNSGYLASYTPSDTLNYNIVVEKVSLKVNKANPIYIIPTPGEITYDSGKTLADVTLPDGWTWNNLGAVPTVDNSGYQASYTPSDTLNYNIVVEKVSLKVNKANPIYIIPTPGEITYDSGKTLAHITLPDGWTWNNPDAVPTVDNSGYQASYTPSDTLNYNIVIEKVNLKVNKANPIYIIPTPGEITYDLGKTLAHITLPDGWTWNNLGAVPTVDNSGYLASYTPSDTLNYNIVVEKVSLKVNKANPIYIIPTPGEITYDSGKTLAHITLPDGWTWNNLDAVPTVDNSGYQASYTPSDTLNYNIVVEKVSLKVNKAETLLHIHCSHITYGKGEIIPTIVTNLSSGQVSYKYYTNSSCTNEINKPIQAGTYYIRGYVQATENYKAGVSEAVEFVISKADITNYTVQYPTSVRTGESETIKVTNLPIGAGSILITAKNLKAYEVNDNSAKFTMPSTAQVINFTIDILESDNYNSCSTSIEINVTDKIETDIILTADKKEFKYGDIVTYEAKEKNNIEGIFTFKVDGKIALSTKSNTYKYRFYDTLEHTITVDYIPTNKIDYAIGSKALSQMASKANLIITVDNINILMNDKLPSFTYDIEGLIGKDIVEKEPIFSTIGKTSRAGLFDINASSIIVSNNNYYHITYVKGNLRIIQSYKVTFVNYDGAVLNTQTVVTGKSATVPDEPNRKGYTFIDWDNKFDKVTSDIIIKARYNKITDSTLLNELVISFQELDKSNHTKEGWSKVQAAIDKAKAALKNPDITQEEIDSIYVTLSAFLNAQIINTNNTNDNIKKYLLIATLISSLVLVTVIVKVRKKGRKI